MVLADPYSTFEKGVLAALETYSNVHRGSGHHSVVSTHLFEEARNIVLEYLRLAKSKYTVVFCSPRRAAALARRLRSGTFYSVSSVDLGLPLGVRALAVKKQALPKGVPCRHSACYQHHRVCPRAATGKGNGPSQ